MISGRIAAPDGFDLPARDGSDLPARDGSGWSQHRDSRALRGYLIVTEADFLLRARFGLLVSVAVCCVLVWLSGCVEVGVTPELVTITFAHPDADGEYYQTLADSFNEQYPFITVELHPKTWRALEGVDVDEEDVFVTSQFALSWLLAEDLVLDVTPFIDHDETFNPSDLYPGTLALYTRDGKTWAVPAAVDLMVMYYNEDLCDRYGVTYPEAGWTWDTFLDTALALRDPSMGTFGYAASYSPDRAIFDPLVFVYQHGGRVFDDLVNPTRPTFDEPLTVEAMEWYAGLLHEYDVAPSPDQAREAFVDYPYYYSGILEGRFGLWAGMLSERGGASGPAEWKIPWGVVPLPRDSQSATMTMVDGHFISSHTSHPDACWKWVSFLSQQTPHRHAPARRSVAESAEYEQRVGDTVASTVRASMEGALMLSPRLAEFEDALASLGRAVDAIINLQATPQEAMSQAQERSR